MFSNAAADGIGEKRRCSCAIRDDIDLFIKQSGMAEFQEILYERLLQRHEEHFTAVVIENHAARARQQFCPARFRGGFTARRGKRYGNTTHGKYAFPE